VTADRVPRDVLDRIQAEETPIDCGPHCHQGAVLEALVDEIRGLRRDARDRHRAVLSELADAKGAISDLQVQFGQLAMVQARTAALAGETASHQALSAEDAARRAPRDSVAPSRSGSRRPSSRLLWALGVVLAGAAATVADRCVPSRPHASTPPPEQWHAGP